jgi:hypothetical protein
VHPSDLLDPDTSVQSKLPYCGARSEMEFFLPIVRTMTTAPAQCAMCPWNDCPTVQKLARGEAVDISCIVEDVDSSGGPGDGIGAGGARGVNGTSS